MSIPKDKQAPKNFVFTVNNYGSKDEAEQMVENWIETGKCHYMVVAFEVGASGTPHLQGYVELTKPPLKFRALMKYPLFARAHIEKRLGTAQQASDYCKKGDQTHQEWQDKGVNGANYGVNAAILTEHGELKIQGRRTDLEQVYDAAKAGATTMEIIEENPAAYIRNFKGIEAVKDAMIKPRDHNEATECICYYGPTGTGKTRKAVEDNPGAFIQGPGMKQWFDGYQGEKTVIFDEYRGQLPFGQLLKLMDRYAERVERKGGSCQFAGRLLIFTMPTHPRKLYPGLEERDGKMDQLRRRFNKIYKFGGSDPSNPSMQDVTARPWCD